MKNTITDYIKNLSLAINSIDKNEVFKIAEVLNDARIKGKNIYIFGNGGSGSTATHFACDINKGCSKEGHDRFKIICLNDNIPTMLAYSNDIGYEFVFKEQLENFLQEGEIVIGISGSGNSKNIINAIEFANSKNAITVGITGFNGGKLKSISRFSFNANINDMQLSEDLHMIWVHIMMKCFTI